MQRYKTSNDAGQPMAMRDGTFGHQSIVGTGARLVKENFESAPREADEGARSAW